MDTETVITLIIVAVGVLWNLVVKMREKMTLPESPPPWPNQEEPVETYMEDLSPYTVIEEEEITGPLLKNEPAAQENSFFLSAMKEKQDVPDTKSVYDRGYRKRRSKYKGMSQSKLKEAVIWSEILAPPLSLRSGR